MPNRKALLPLALLHILVTALIVATVYTVLKSFAFPVIVVMVAFALAANLFMLEETTFPIYRGVKFSEFLTK